MRLIAAFAAAVLAIVGVTAASLRSLAARRDWTEWVTLTQDVRFAVERVLALSTDQETTQRGFLLTGREQYLEPFEGAVAGVDDQLDRLASLSHDNPRQLQRLAALRPLLRGKADALRRAISLRRKGDPAAFAGVSSGEAGETMQQVRRLLAEMRDERAVDELRASSPGREIRIESAQPAIHGHWDGDRVLQVISNLVSNALQYGAAGRPITVSLSGDAQGSLEVRVHNHGPAMPAKVRQHLFEPYRRGKGAESSHPRGLGLGLFIVREIARAHGGSVEVHSDVELGTTLTVRLSGRHLPLPRASGSAAPAQASAAELPAS